jgi:hypothetical protein
MLMAQLLMTFEELGELFGCDAAEARSYVIINQWERRRSSECTTRAVVPAELTMEFMLSFVEMMGRRAYLTSDALPHSAIEIRPLTFHLEQACPNVRENEPN